MMKNKEKALYFSELLVYNISIKSQEIGENKNEMSILCVC